MNFAFGVFLFRVVDRFVLGVLVRDAPVGIPFVGVDGFNVSGDILTDEAVQVSRSLPLTT